MMDFKKEFIPENCLEKKSKNTIRIWKNFLSDARLPNKHSEVVESLSENVLHNHLCHIDQRASSKIVQSLFEDRSYDSFGNHKVRDKLDSSSRDVIQPNSTRKDLISLAAEATLNIDEEQEYLRDDKLTTSSSKIGVKPLKHGPPGLSTPIQNIPNSEGNEIFFSCESFFITCNILGIRSLFSFESSPYRIKFINPCKYLLC